LGDVTLVTSRAFMNRLVAIDNYAYQRSYSHLPHGDLGHSRPGYRDVDHGGQAPRRDLRPVCKQSARTPVSRDRCHLGRHDVQ
jgi:hypothetical protein